MTARPGVGGRHYSALPCLMRSGTLCSVHWCVHQRDSRAFASFLPNRKKVVGTASCAHSWRLPLLFASTERNDGRRDARSKTRRSGVCWCVKQCARCRPKAESGLHFRTLHRLTPSCDCQRGHLSSLNWCCWSAQQWQRCKRGPASPGQHYATESIAADDPPDVADHQFHSLCDEAGM
jgi:hypothetical protein